jgi:sugar O-acyltransferase (sialic acid O-acetyltransferase NeuD family)
MQPLLVVGGGGLGREVAEAVRAINGVAPTWDLIGFVDDDPELQERLVAGRPVLGPVSSVDSYPGVKLVLALGSTENLYARRRVADDLRLPLDRYATIVHPAAVLAASTTIGPGSIVLAGAVTTADVRLGAHVVVMPHAVLTHDDLVGDFVTLAAGASLAGMVTVAEGAYVGCQAVVRERLSIGAWSILGMGAVVTTDVPPGEVWVGNPARLLRRTSRGAHDDALAGPADVAFG